MTIIIICCIISTIFAWYYAGDIEEHINEMSEEDFDKLRMGGFEVLAQFFSPWNYIFFFFQEKELR